MIKKFLEHSDSNDKLEFSLDDIIDAVQYGFDYRVSSQNDGKSVPVGNILQWLMSKKELLHIPKEFKDIRNKK